MLCTTHRRRLTAPRRVSHARRASTVRQLAILVGVASAFLGGLVAPAASFGFPPVNTSPPQITGTAQQGQILSEVHGSWMNFPTSYAYQWQRCNSSGTGCSSISGATAQTYVPLAEDVGHKLSVKETASNFSGPGSPAESEATAVVVPPVPENTVPPTIAGTVQQGQTLSEAHGSWTNSPTGYTYQWLRCDSSGASCVSISGATAQAYVPLAEDVGHRLRVKETGSNAGGSGTAAESEATAVVVPPVPENTVPPTIAGTVQQGQTLSEAHGSWTNSPTGYTYQWLRCDSSGASCVSISGATAQAYVPLAEDVGHRLRVKETGSNAGGSGTAAESEATAVVVPPVPENTVPPTIAGTVQQGQTLSEAHGSWTNSPTGYTYQWLRCDSSGASCVSISGATAQAYVPLAEDVGHRLRLQETASNAGGSSGPAASVLTAVVNAPAQPTTSTFTSLLSNVAPGDPPAPPTPLVITVRSVSVDRHGVVAIPIDCPAGAAGGCHGKITITIQVSAPRGKRARASRCARGCRPLGTTSYEARAGQKVRVRVHIASFGRRLLKQHSSVRVTLTATSVSGGQTATVTRAIALKPQ